MSLRIGVELRDFDFERVGFSLSVLDETRTRRVSEGYLQMSLLELDSFLKALKAAREDIELAAIDTEAPPPLVLTMPKPPVLGSPEPARMEEEQQAEDAESVAGPLKKALWSR